MTEYKKLAPENTSGSMTHYIDRQHEVGIEWHLAEILNIVETFQSDLFSELSAYVEEIEEIKDRVRKAWDMVPEPEEIVIPKRFFCSASSTRCHKFKTQCVYCKEVRIDD